MGNAPKREIFFRGISPREPLLRGAPDSTDGRPLPTPALSLGERIPRKISGFESLNRSVTSRIGLLTSGFPSPWPSPLGRGNRTARLWKNSGSLGKFQIGKRSSLSLRERVGVRGRG